MAAKIEWGEPKPHGNYGAQAACLRRDGRIGDLLVAQVLQGVEEKDKWYVTMLLDPLSDRLDAMTDTIKASEESAKRTAQRIVNEFTKILNG